MRKLAFLAFSLSAIVCLAADPPAAKRPVELEWKLGMVGSFPQPDQRVFATWGCKDYFEVLEVISDKEVLLQGIRRIPGSAVGNGKTITSSSPGREEKIHKPFILRGPSTKGLVDYAKINLEETYKVVDTAKQGGRTVFVIELAPPEAKKEEPKKEEPPAPATPDPEKVKADAERKKQQAAAKVIADKEQDERNAATGLRLIKGLMAKGKKDDAKVALLNLIRNYPQAPAAAEAREILKMFP